MIGLCFCKQTCMQGHRLGHDWPAQWLLASASAGTALHKVSFTMMYCRCHLLGATAIMQSIPLTLAFMRRQSTTTLPLGCKGTAKFAKQLFTMIKCHSNMGAKTEPTWSCDAM